LAREGHLPPWPDTGAADLSVGLTMEKAVIRA